MSKEGFKYPTIHSLDAGLYDVSYRERFDKWTDSKAEISLLKQHDHVYDHIDVLISNFYYPDKVVKNQQAIFKLSKDAAKRLRDYLSQELVTMQ
ncbi:hypothetical protein [Limosilactobacillus pontis]|uniref:Uncharacterized protein n=1 Tax=Limosilactobacillus pontis TaxID=35787 RepID=A0ABU7STV1_9LACO